MRTENRTIRAIPVDDRPYERCLREGPSALTDAELLAVILRTGTKNCSAVELAGRILSQSGSEEGLLSILHRSTQELCAIRGIGKVKAIQIRCIGELSKRIAGRSARRDLVLDRPETIADCYMERLRHCEQEQVLCMMLDAKNRLIADPVMSVGTVNSSLISPREIFRAACAHRAVGIVLVHNHPSGDATPSPEDVAVTDQVAEAGEILGIRLLDHIIIGDRSYMSFHRSGLITRDPDGRT